MKKGFYILFLAIYIITATEFREFLKIPILVEHFIEHKNQNKNLSFLDFLRLHYSQKNSHKDYKHLDFPFKNHCNQHFIDISIYIPSKIFILEFKKIKYYFKKNNLNYIQPLFESTSISAIWQPPKF